MKHNPKIHTQIHPVGTHPVHDGVYRVKLSGEWFWCKWAGFFWYMSRPTFDEAKNETEIGSQEKAWYGLRKKPKGKE